MQFGLVTCLGMLFLLAHELFIQNEEPFLSLFKALPCCGCFIAYISVHFPLVELNKRIWFSNMPGPSVGVRVVKI